MNKTTTELLNAIRNHGSEALLDALELMQNLDQRLSSGEPLPDQWKGKSDRDVVDAFVTHPDRYGFSSRHTHESPGVYVVTLSSAWQISFIPMAFTGKSLDEAYHLAAEWVRSQQP